jgi:hypothetical protein
MPRNSDTHCLLQNIDRFVPPPGPYVCAAIGQSALRSLARGVRPRKVFL